MLTGKIRGGRNPKGVLAQEGGGLEMWLARRAEKKCPARSAR